jgi:hypothetical protein
VVLTYGVTYRFKGWTILPSFDGTRLINDVTRIASALER